MQKFTPQEEQIINQLASSFRQQPTFSQVQVQDKKKKGNWATDLIPTAASILGGAVGTVVAPGVGTAAGGALGGALGAKLKGAFTGEDVGTGEVLKEGAFGALGGIGRASRAVGAAGGAIKSGEGVSRAAQILRQGAPEGYKGAIKRGAGSLADGAALKSLRPSPSQIFNFENKTKQDLGQYMLNNKLAGKSPDQIRDTLVKPLDESFSSTVTNIGRPITGDEILSVAARKLSPLEKSVIPADRRLAQQLSDEVFQIAGAGSMSPKVASATKSRYDALSNSYKASGTDPERLDVSKRMADILRETLQGADPTGKLKSIGRESQAAKEFLTIAEKQANLGKGAMPAGLTTLLGGGLGFGGLAAGGPMGALGGAALGLGVTKMANSPKVLAGVSNAANKVASTVPRNAASPIEAAKGMAKIQVPLSLAGSALSPQSTSAEPSGQSADSGDVSQILGLLSKQAAPKQQSMYPIENAIGDIQQDLAATGGKNMDSIMKFYQFSNPQESAANKKQSVKMQDALVKAANAESVIGQLQSQYDQVGGGQGRIGGFFQSLLGKAGVNDKVDEYNQNKDAKVASIARALGEVGTLTDQDIQRAMGNIPSVSDTPAVGKAKIQNILDILDQAKRNAQTYYGGSGSSYSAEDILSAYGMAQ